MGWGKQDCAIVVRGAICAMLSVSKRRATPHPTGFAGHLPQPKLGKGSARRFEMCEYRRVRPRGESNPGDDGLRLSPGSPRRAHALLAMRPTAIVIASPSEARAWRSRAKRGRGDLGIVGLSEFLRIGASRFLR